MSLSIPSFRNPSFAELRPRVRPAVYPIRCNYARRIFPTFTTDSARFGPSSPSEAEIVHAAQSVQVSSHRMLISSVQEQGFSFGFFNVTRNFLTV